VPLLLIYVPQLTGWRLHFQGPEIIYLIQLILFAVLALLFQLSPLRYTLTPWAVKKARARRNAMEQFIAQNMHTTKKRTGVLIFVSVAERFVEVLADEEIARKVDQTVWQQAVEALTSNIGKRRPVEGFEAAIEICGKVLAEHFPPGEMNSDELPNHLIELD
jgi:putative membrane protein